jgi:catechol 2,3-dioxygenase-like lactoylglutathione lyase family enzyme
MRINVTSVLVDDQDKALRFYTDVLGFVKKAEIPLGEARWLTVVSPEEPEGTELLLEPDAHPAAKPFKQALVEDGIPFTSFAVEDVPDEYERLRALGVRFTQEPVEAGPVTRAVFDDNVRQPDPNREPEVAAYARGSASRPQTKGRDHAQDDHGRGGLPERVHRRRQRRGRAAIRLVRNGDVAWSFPGMASFGMKWGYKSQLDALERHLSH